MTPGLWLLVGLAAVAIAGWAYGTREERVAGRGGPAAVRAAAIFLILGGLALPALRGGGVGAPERVVLLDVSGSMALPVRAADPAARTRLDSALAVLPELMPDRIYLFGDSPVPSRLDSLDAVAADHGASRLEPAIEAARLGGADSVWVLTDGDLTDREAAAGTAEDLGLGVRELRVAAPPLRVGLAGLCAPDRARAGDTVRVTLEFRAGGEVGAGVGGLPDSVSVQLERDGDVVAAGRAPRPAPGRTGRAELAFVPRNEGDRPAWRRYEAVLTDPPDPFGVASRAGAWIEISESAAGAVLVSMVPDWEARFLVPALDRLVLGGARGYLRLIDGRFLEMGASPRIVDESRVRNAVQGSRLLAVQGAPEDIPPWLAGALRAHPRTLFFTEGPGDVPGVGARMTGPLPGEWYPAGPVPASPSSALLAEADLDLLPPVRELYAVEPAGRWSVINAHRNRRGEGRPLLTAGEDGARRWALAVASDWWRWSLRGDEPRRVYEGVFSGIVGWLVEDATPRLASLVRSPTVGRPPVWRLRPGSTDLSIRLLDEEGTEVWSDSAAEPPPEIVGPALPPGRYEAIVAATGPDGPVELRRPFEVTPDPRELMPGPASELLHIEAQVASRPPMDVRPPRPVWPFLLAVLLLCVEWVWRHRIGLR
ncbi:vWA domain-containing protein [Candidatus Palauibacter sp.]|uniref:vWA domain-containing protein n=1 Tax=Candidatus Palauibacter sp. TaxID=3101350 RepID=UPI003B58D58F